MTVSSDSREAPPAGQPASEPAREAKRTAGIAGRKAAELAAEGKASAARYVSGLSAAVEASCETLEREGHLQSAQALRRVAVEMDGLASSFDGKAGGEIVRELESFAHKRPGLFFGGALLAGFGLSRFLRSAEQAPDPAPPATDR